MSPIINVLTYGFNAAVRERVIDPRLPSMGLGGEKIGHLHTLIDGHPAVVLWQIDFHNYMLFSVWFKYDHSKHPQADLPGASEKFTTDRPLAKRSHYHKFVGAVVSGRIDLNDDYFQGFDRDEVWEWYTRSDAKNALRSLPEVEPLGLSALGNRSRAIPTAFLCA
jgi:hypothetical protein